MQSLLKWLRSLGPVGSFTANVLSILATNWVLTMSAVLGLWASFTDSVVALSENPRVHTALIVFLVLLWTSVGIAYLIDRRKPTYIRAAHDYRYGLTFEGVMPVYQPGHPEGVLAFGINLKNYSSGPIRYTVEVFDVRVGTRALPKVQKGKLTSFMPRGGGRTSTTVPFSAKDVQDFTNGRVDGIISVAIVYGHPEESPVRRLSMELGVTLEIKEATKEIIFGSDIREESDTAIV